MFNRQFDHPIPLVFDPLNAERRYLVIDFVDLVLCKLLSSMLPVEFAAADGETILVDLAVVAVVIELSDWDVDKEGVEVDDTDLVPSSEFI